MLMIGVSTGQNITNLIPAVHENFNIDEFILLESSTAKRLKWTDGISKVLKLKNIQLEVLDIHNIDNNIIEIKTFIENRIKDFKEPIYWNLGGGQKPQQIAIWEIFKKRNSDKNIPDIVCYANQDDKGIMEIWEYNENILIQKEEKIKVKLNAEEIFNVFGCNAVGQTKKIYEKDKFIEHQNIPNLLKFNEFREYFFRLPQVNYDIERQPLSLFQIREILNKEKKELNTKFFDVLSIMIESNKIENLIKNKDYRQIAFNSALKKTNLLFEIFNIIKSNLSPPVIEVENNELKLILKREEIIINDVIVKELTNQKLKKSADLFENIIADKVKNLLETEDHNIVEAYTNYEIEKYGRYVAEYDVLCVTNKGTIIALDAKTFNFESKDIDARLYNLEQGSGYYRTFSAVFPYDYDDIGKEYFKPIEELPFQLSKRNFSFYVVNDSHKSNFWIKKNEEKKIIKSLIKPIEDDCIKCRTLNEFIRN